MNLHGKTGERVMAQAQLRSHGMQSVTYDKAIT